MKESKATNVIKITTGQEHGILDNQNITDQESLMYPAFRAALDALAGIVRYSDAWNERNGGENQKADIFYGYSNNILAFCAPRGQGKTSAMLSFSKAIESGGFIQGKDAELGYVPKKYYFRALPPIDPTMLREGESVVQLVLGKLFKEISDLWEKPQQRGKYWDTAAQQETQKFQILDEFKACYHGLYYINKQGDQGKDIDDFEKMLTASDVFQLKEHLHNIIMYFFQLLGHVPEESFLLIQLDDTDMQMENAYLILEEVRKYLSIPNVVVLMATHLEQLRTLITQRFATQLHGKTQSGKFDEATRRMAAKYLDKLIPASQAVYLPTMRLHRDTEQKLLLVIEQAGKELAKPEDLENKMFAIIYEKTGLVFIRHDNYMHNLLPTTLRGLQHLYRLLDQMESLNKPKAIEFANDAQRKQQLREYCSEMRVYLQKKHRNLLLFESYFLNDWCSSKIGDEDLQMLKRIDKTASIRRLPYAVQCLQQRHGSSERETCPSPVLVWSLSAKEKSDISAVWKNIASIEQTKTLFQLPKGNGERENGKHFIQLMQVLAKEARQCVTEEDYLFVFAVETYFSIQLNKLAIVDQIASMDEILKQLEKDMPVESLFLYKFNQLIKHLHGDHTLLEKIGLEELRKAFEMLSDMLTKNKLECSNKDYSEQLLALFLQLFSLNDSPIEGPQINKNAINLQEYAVYICCNLDVLAQILRKTADFNYKDTETLAQYFRRLKEEIVTNKETRAYPFYPPDSENLYNILQHLITYETKRLGVVNAAVVETAKDNP